MTREVIPVHKHYLVIDSPIPFTLIANDGTDEVYRPSGAWQIDLWSILTKEYFKQYPVFKLEIEYDETKLEEGQGIVYRQSDINLGTGLSGVNGQAVQIIGDSSGLATKDKQNETISAIRNIDLSALATVAKQNDIISTIQNMDLSALATIAKQNDIISAIQNIDLSSVSKETTLQSILSYLPELKKKVFRINYYYTYNDFKALLEDYNYLLTDIEGSNIYFFNNVLFCYAYNNYKGCISVNSSNNIVFVGFEIDNTNNKIKECYYEFRNNNWSLQKQPISFPHTINMLAIV